MAQVDVTLSEITEYCNHAHQEIEKIADRASHQAQATLEIALTLNQSREVSADGARSILALSSEAAKLVLLADDLTASTARFQTSD